MSQHDFSPLYKHYPEVISQMEATFTSHQFILELARQNQAQYIEALYSYRHHTHRDTPAPFMMVHGVIAQHLLSYHNHIEQLRKDSPSKNIFGEDDKCSEWRKV